MDAEEFRKMVKKSGRSLLFSNESYGKLPWEDWYKLADRTSKINYGCKFWSNGSCTQTRRLEKEGYGPDKMCCCKDCAHSIGYLRFVQNDPKVIDEIVSHFRPKIGFWRKNKGCVLPRKYRSAVCLGYRCGDASQSTIYGNGNILLAFLDAVRLHSLKGRDLYNLGKALLSISI